KNRWGHAGFAAEALDGVACDLHRGERLLEGVVAKEVERNVGLGIHGIARTNNDGMVVTIDGDELALRFIGRDDRNERRRRWRERSKRFWRFKDGCEVLRL